MTLPRIVNCSTAAYVRVIASNRAVNSLSKLQTRSASTSSNAKKTPLYDLHVQNNGKLVDFAGYLLPVQYSDLGISASHLHTRQHASIFDVSHMLQTYVRGKDAIECFESICTADIKGLAPNSGSLTVFTNENGGIFDDLIVTKVSDDLLYVVSNAACSAQDIGIIRECVVSIPNLVCDQLINMGLIRIISISQKKHISPGTLQKIGQRCFGGIPRK